MVKTFKLKFNTKKNHFEKFSNFTNAEILGGKCTEMEGINGRVNFKS